MNRQECIDFANENLKKWGLIELGWSFSFIKRKRTLGLCSYSKKKIFLSIHHMNSSDDEVKDTILHEIAHALSFTHDKERGHKYHWKKWCRTIGAKPDRCGTSSGMTYKYQIYCPHCRKAIAQCHRKFRSSKICRKCRTIVVCIENKPNNEDEISIADRLHAMFAETSSTPVFINPILRNHLNQIRNLIFEG